MRIFGVLILFNVLDATGLFLNPLEKIVNSGACCFATLLLYYFATLQFWNFYFATITMQLYYFATLKLYCFIALYFS